MKKLIIILLIGSLSLMSFVTNKTHSLTVEVTNLQNSDGVVLFLLYNKEGTIPDKHQKKQYKKLSADIVNDTSTITFKDLPEGNYAVNIIHDENNNGKLDKGFILPKEGIGFSKYKTINIRNRPSFSKASFYLDADFSISIKTIYM